MTVQPASWVRTCAPPMTTWIANSTAVPTASRTSVGWSRCVRQATTARAITTSPTIAGDPAVEDHRRGRVGQRRHERAAHQRPVGEDERRRGGGDVRPEQQEREGERRRERREQREPLAAAPAADPRRVAGPDGHVDQERDQGQGGGQVRGHRLPAVAEADRLAPEPGLEPDQRDRRRATATGSSAGRGSRGWRGSPARGSRSR